MAFRDCFREFHNIQVSNDILLRQVIPDQDAKDFYELVVMIIHGLLYIIIK